MPRSARIFVVLAALLLGVLPVCAQDPDIEALIHILTAPDLKSAIRHFPPEIQQGIDKLSRDQRKELGRMFPVADRLREEKVTLQISPDAGPFVVFDDGHGGWFSHMEFFLVKREYGNDRSELTLQLRSGNDPPSDSDNVILRLKYVYPDWRIYEAEVPSENKIQRFDDEKSVEKFVESTIHDNESRACSRLTNYVNSISRYIAIYPDLGAPETLDQLGAPPDEDSPPDAAQAGLIDEELSKPPYESSRYRFTYKRIDAERFSVTARPVKFGVTGRRSFYVDESGTIRATEKDEAATARSKPFE